MHFAEVLGGHCSYICCTSIGISFHGLYIVALDILCAAVLLLFLGAAVATFLRVFPTGSTTIHIPVEFLAVKTPVVYLWSFERNRNSTCAAVWLLGVLPGCALLLVGVVVWT